MNVFLARPGREEVGEVCKVDLFLWLGKTEHVQECWSVVPAGYEKTEHASLFPRSLVYEKAFVSDFDRKKMCQANHIVRSECSQHRKAHLLIFTIGGDIRVALLIISNVR